MTKKEKGAFLKEAKVGEGKVPWGLQLPASVVPPVIDLTEWGGRLPTQTYFPMYLGNGRDAMLINLLGSGEMHWEHPMRSANPLTRLLNTEWYRADRRDHGHSALAYGQLMPFVNFSAGPMLRGEFVVPRDVRQYFHPRTATLTTMLSQLDNRTLERLELRIQTYLTAEGLLVQVVHCLAAPEAGAQYIFTMEEPGPEYQNAQVPLVKPEGVRFTPEVDDLNLLWYSSTWEQGRAVGFSLVGGVGVSRSVEHRSAAPTPLQAEQVTEVFHQGATFWRIMALQDSREGEGEGDNPDALCEELLGRVARLGVEGLAAAHRVGWEEYFATSSVTLPDPTAQFLYEVSRYNIKANLHPCGLLPMGTLPYLWQGAMFWDAAFGHQALLGCGNFAEARSITNHLATLEGHGRDLARAMGSEGIRLEWTVNLFDFSKYDPPTFQIHNNAVWAHCAFLEEIYQARELDERMVGFVRGLLAFLVDRLALRGDTAPEPIIGVDESYCDPKPNDTWSLAACLAALDDYQQFCKRRGIVDDLPGLAEARERLDALLAGNVDAAGVLQSFTGGALPHWGSLVFDLFPDLESALPTLGLMTQNYSAECDLFNFHGLNRYAERAFPWANNWVARCLARMRRPEALHYWLNNTRATNTFGGVPERVYYHGENYINWCMTGHAAQVWAMNAMLADFRDGRLTLLGGIDPALWQNLAYEDLRVEGGLAVSLTLQEGAVTSLRIHSTATVPQEVSIHTPGFGSPQSRRIEPGENILIS